MRLQISDEISSIESVRHYSENDSLVQEIDSVCPPAVAATDFPRRVSSGAPASTLGFPTIECEPTTESGLIGEIDSFIRRAEKYLVGISV